MNKAFHLVLLLLLAIPTFCQGTFLGYSIAQDSVVLPIGKETLAIYYSATNCHQCMERLAQKALRWKSRNPNRVVYVVTYGESIPFRRMQVGEV